MITFFKIKSGFEKKKRERGRIENDLSYRKIDYEKNFDFFITSCKFHV